MKNAWLRDWLLGLSLAVALGVAFAAVCVFFLAFQGSAAWAEMLLEPAFGKPEVVGFYAAALMDQVRLAILACLGAAAAGFLLWDLAVLFGRPTGPGEVRGGWRFVLWCVVLAGVAAAGGLVPYWLLAVRLDTVDTEAAWRLSAILALSGGVLFWLLSVVGAGSMMRPAVPFGRYVHLR